MASTCLHDDDCARDVLLLHALAVGLDGLDADLEVLGEEDEHLVGGVVVVRHQDDQVLARGLLLARLVAELRLELVQRLVQLVLRHLRRRRRDCILNTSPSNDLDAQGYQDSRVARLAWPQELGTLHTTTLHIK